MVPKRRPKSNTPPMNHKKDEIIFGARCAGVTCFYQFKTRTQLKKSASRRKETRPKFSPVAQLALPLVSWP